MQIETENERDRRSSTYYENKDARGGRDHKRSGAGEWDRFDREHADWDRDNRGENKDYYNRPSKGGGDYHRHSSNKDYGSRKTFKENRDYDRPSYRERDGNRHRSGERVSRADDYHPYSVNKDSKIANDRNH